VYTGNYVFRPEALKYFIPFADLRLRMLGPSLGRVIRSEIGGRFVSANLPMLHKRTVEDTGRSEFRPGINARSEVIELCGEFERQFHGDVMLFSLEQLARQNFCFDDSAVAAIVESVHAELLEKYRTKHLGIIEKLDLLMSLLHDQSQWWHRTPGHSSAISHFNTFVANMQHNFGTDSLCYKGIQTNWTEWRDTLIQAIKRYPQERVAWDAVLAAHTGMA
jgi:hypothetical protein